MSKDKARHDPEKAENNYGGDGQCPYWDHVWSPTNGEQHVCELGRAWDRNCKGNQHYCEKARLKYIAASRDKSIKEAE